MLGAVKRRSEVSRLQRQAFHYLHPVLRCSNRPRVGAIADKSLDFLSLRNFCGLLAVCWIGNCSNSFPRQFDGKMETAMERLPRTRFSGEHFVCLLPAHGTRLLLASLLACVADVTFAQTPPGSTSSQAAAVVLDRPVTVLTSAQIEQVFNHSATRAVVLIFVLPDCPIANSYAPAYSRLHAAYAKLGIPILLVHVDANLTESAARQHARKYALDCPLFLDPEHAWVQQAGATKTPEAVIFSCDREILYRGRIDNRYAAPGKRRPEATMHDLRNSLDAVLAGKPVPQARTEAVGCPIPELDDED